MEGEDLNAYEWHDRNSLGKTEIMAASGCNKNLRLMKLVLLSITGR